MIQEVTFPFIATLREIQNVARDKGVAAAAKHAFACDIPFEIAHVLLKPYCSRREVARLAS